MFFKVTNIHLYTNQKETNIHHNQITIQLTPLNNYLSDYVNISNYTHTGHC
jgi:hypothetical protein